jgi:hypothetical protein
MTKERLQAAIQELAVGIDSRLEYLSGMSPYRRQCFERDLKTYEFLRARLAELEQEAHDRQSA